MKKYKINVSKWNLEKYNSSPLFYQKFQILLLMENANTHLVSLFKDYLLYDDTTEFLKDYYYKNKEIYQRLKTIYDYYESSSYLFPNYTAINEGKYIYRNIIKKQKLIDYLEDLEDKKKEKEDKRKEKEEKKKKLTNLNLYQSEQSSSWFDVFDTKIYNNIIKETGNDSKINELFCVGNNGNNEYGDSISSILKLTEEMKEKELTKEIKNNKHESKEKDKNIINNNNNNKNSNSNFNLSNINNKIKKKFGTKIYVSRRINMNSSKINTTKSKKIFKKPKINININNILNNNLNNNLNSKITSPNYCNRNQILNSDAFKTNDYLKSNLSYINSKNNYKKNNIIINIINNNKTNNYQSNINYFSNYTNSSPNNIQHDNKSNAITSDNSKYNSINNKKYSTKNNNIYHRHNTTIKDQNELKSVITKYSQNHNKKISKKIIKDTKSKLLSFHLTTESNLTDRIKTGQSQSNLNKTGKDLSKTKSMLSPRNNKMNKRTKTEILRNKNDVFIFGQQNEINPYNYNKSINRQILKNINLTNDHKPHKDISLINKKIINYHFGLNSSKIDKKYIKHISTNSQNLTGVNILNKVSLLPLKEIIKKKNGIFSFNNTERTSRNQSKEQINKHNTMTKRIDSFSPKKKQDEIYKKMKRIHNKKSGIISSFFKSIGSNQEIKGAKINKRKNNSNSITYKGINTMINSKEIFNRISNDKNF